MNVMRRAALPAAAIVMGLLLASAGEAGKRKVDICHKGVDVSVSANAVDAHLANHADFLGPCQPKATCPCWTGGELKAAVQAGLATEGAVIECDAGFILRSEDELSIHASVIVTNDSGGTGGELDYVEEDGVLVFSECQLDSFGTGVDVGLEPIRVQDISLEEAEACRRAIGKACKEAVR